MFCFAVTLISLHPFLDGLCLPNFGLLSLAPPVAMHLPPLPPPLPPRHEDYPASPFVPSSPSILLRASGSMPGVWEGSVRPDNLHWKIRDQNLKYLRGLSYGPVRSRPKKKHGKMFRDNSLQRQNLGFLGAAQHHWLLVGCWWLLARVVR